MIHYHGTPISSRVTAAKFLAGRHALVSHEAPDHIEVASAVCQSFVLDNGAFSAFTKGAPVTDWTPYYRWAGAWLADPCCDWALVPDVIDGSAEDNDRMLREWPHGRDRGVPVYHLHEPVDRLAELAVSWPRVALGSSGEYWQVGSPAWWGRVAALMAAVCDADGRPRCRLHGLRMLDWRVFTWLPLASADSVNVGMNCGRSARLFAVDPAAGAEVIAARVEGHNSARAWRGAPPA